MAILGLSGVSHVLRFAEVLGSTLWFCEHLIIHRYSMEGILAGRGHSGGRSSSSPDGRIEKAQKRVFYFIYLVYFTYFPFLLNFILSFGSFLFMVFDFEFVIFTYFLKQFLDLGCFLLHVCAQK